MQAECYEVDVALGVLYEQACGELFGVLLKMLYQSMLVLADGVIREIEALQQCWEIVPCSQAATWRKGLVRNRGVMLCAGLAQMIEAVFVDERIHANTEATLRGQPAYIIPGMLGERHEATRKDRITHGLQRVFQGVLGRGGIDCIDQRCGKKAFQVDHHRAAAMGDDVFEMEVDAVQGVDDGYLSAESMVEQGVLCCGLAVQMEDFLRPAMVCACQRLGCIAREPVAASQDAQQ
ncbi:hypothetical protein D9M71_254990 [compost metagenome]